MFLHYRATTRKHPGRISAQDMGVEAIVGQVGAF
jgi:hypothetical protein